MKHIILCLICILFVSCIQTESETALKKHKGLEDLAMSGTYRMACFTYDPGNGTQMSQSEEIKFINSSVIQWKMIYYWGKADCPEGEEDEVNLFDMEYSYNTEDNIFYEKNYRMRTAFFGDYLTEVNATGGQCGLLNWEEGVLRDVTNLGQEDDSCRNGFFIPDADFYAREESYLTKEKIIMFGRDYLPVSH